MIIKPSHIGYKINRKLLIHPICESIQEIDRYRNEYEEGLNTIILLYEDGHHFKLVGHFQDGNMITLFNQQTIPTEILKMINYLR